MGDYYPDPNLLEQLAALWEGKATELETLRNTFAPGALPVGAYMVNAGQAATDNLIWDGAAEIAARRMLQMVSLNVGNTAELARRWARKLREMAKNVRDELAKEAKNNLITILASIFGLIGGFAFGAFLGTFIADLAESIVAAITTALGIASDVATALLTLTFEFAIGAVIFGTFQFALDMFVEDLASAFTNTPFTFEKNEWQNVLIGALTGGLFSLTGAAFGVKNIPVKGDGADDPGQVTARTNLPDDSYTPSEIDSINGNFDGKNDVSASPAAGQFGGRDNPANLGKADPKSFSPDNANPGNTGLNLEAAPKPAADIKTSESSFTRADPVGGGPGGNRALDTTPHQAAPTDTNGVPVAARPNPSRPGPPENAQPKAIGATGKPQNAQDKSPTPQDVHNTPHQSALDGNPPGSKPAATHLDPNANRSAMPKPPGTGELKATGIDPHANPEADNHGLNPTEQPANPHNQVTEPSLNGHPPSPGHQPAGQVTGKPQTGASTPPPAHAGGGSTGHPGVESTPHENAPQTAVPRHPEAAGPGARGESGNHESISGRQAALRDQIGAARGIDEAHPNVDHDFGKAMYDSGGRRDGITDAQSAKLRSDFSDRVSATFGEHMDKPFREGRAPTGAEKASWTKTYEKMVGDLRTDIRAQGAGNQIDNAVRRMAEKVFGTNRDPATGKLDAHGDGALRSWIRDANGLGKQAVKSGNFRRLDGNLKALEGKFDGYLQAHAGADRAAAAAGAKFDAMVSDRNAKLAGPDAKQGGEHLMRADPERIAASREELTTAARNAYLARAGAKSLFHRGSPDLESLDRQAANWLRNRAGLIDSRLTFLDRTQGEMPGRTHGFQEALGRKEFGQGRLDWAEKKFGPGADGAGKNPLMTQAGKIIDASAGSFAANVRPQYSVAVRSLRTFVEQSAQRTAFSTQARAMLNDARASIKFEAQMGEQAAFERGLNYFGAADRTVAGAEGRLAGSLETQLDRLQLEGFKKNEVARSLDILQKRIDRITGQVRRDTINDAAMLTGAGDAEHMISSEFEGRGVHLGQGTFDRLTGDFREDFVHQFRAENGAGEGLRSETRRWLAAHGVEAAGPKGPVPPRPATGAPKTDLAPGSKAGRDVAHSSAGVDLTGHWSPDVKDPSVFKDGGLAPHDDSVRPAKFADDRPYQFYRADVDIRPLEPGQLPSGLGKIEELLGRVTDPETFGPKGGRPGNHAPISESSKFRLETVGRETGDHKSGAAPVDHEQIALGRPPEYDDLGGRLDAPPAYDGARLPGYQVDFTEASPARDLVVPQALDIPMGGVGKEMDAIRQERRDGVAQGVEDLGRVGRPESKGQSGDGPLRTDDPSGSLRDQAWNEMAKQEADLRATIGDGVRPGEEGGGFARGHRPPPPARSGRAVSEDVARFAQGGENGPRPDADAVDQHVRKLNNGELDRANDWVTRNPGSPARAPIQKEYTARFEADGRRSEAAEAAAQTRPEDLVELRADFEARSAAAQRLNATLDKITEQQQAVREGLRRQHHVPAPVAATPEPMPSFPGLGDRAAELRSLGIEKVPAWVYSPAPADQVAALQRLGYGHEEIREWLRLPSATDKVAALRTRGIDMNQEWLRTDRQVAAADSKLSDIAAERETIASLRKPLDRAIDLAEKTAQSLVRKRFAGEPDESAIRDYDRAVSEVQALQKYREEGLVSFEPRVDPARQELFRSYRDQGAVPEVPEKAIDPESVGEQTLALIRDLRAAAGRLDALPVPRPEDPEWTAAHPGTRADEAIREWLDAYHALHGRWNNLPAWQRQGFQARDTRLEHFQRTATYQHEAGVLDARESAVRAAQGRAADQAAAQAAESRPEGSENKPTVPAPKPAARRPAAPPARPVRPAGSKPVEQSPVGTRPVGQKPAGPTVEDEPPLVQPDADPASPDLMHFSDPERLQDWLKVRGKLIEGLFSRLGHAAVIDRILPNVESDFTRTWHSVSEGSSITESQLIEQFEKFGEAVARTVQETFGAAFAEARMPTQAERRLWQPRYDDLLRDLGADLRQQIGHNEIRAAADAAFLRWEAENPGGASIHNEALLHWTRDAELRLTSFRKTRTWEYAPRVLTAMIKRLDVYRAVYRTVPTATARVGARFDELVAARPQMEADLRRVLQSRAEAIAAGHDRYVRWWDKRMDEAVTDLEATTAKALDRFRVLDDAIEARLDYLDGTQVILDSMYRMTEPDMLPKSPLIEGLTAGQLASAARILQREAEFVVDRRATPFVADPPTFNDSWFKWVSRPVNELRDQLPARAAFAARAAELAQGALSEINTDAAYGAAEAVRHGLDPAVALSRVRAEARTQVFAQVGEVREQFAAQQYAEKELAGKLSWLEAKIGRTVGRVRADTVRDALLRTGDAEAVDVLNQYASRIGARFSRPVQQKVYGDFEGRYVNRFHDLFADGTEFDVAGWLSRTPPEKPKQKALPETAPENRLLTYPAEVWGGSMEFSSDGRLISKTTGDGYVEEFDGQGRPVKLTTPEGRVWLTEYRGDGKVSTGPDGAEFEYDGGGVLIRRTSASGEDLPVEKPEIVEPVESATPRPLEEFGEGLEFLSAGRRVRRPDVVGSKEEFDDQGRRVKVTTPEGRVWLIGYRGDHKVLTGPYGERLEFDGGGALIRRTSPTGEDLPLEDPETVTPAEPEATEPAAAAIRPPRAKPAKPPRAKPPRAKPPRPAAGTIVLERPNLTRVTDGARAFAKRIDDLLARAEANGTSSTTALSHPGSSTSDLSRPGSPRVDEVTGQRFETTLGDFRRADLFGGRYLSDHDYTQLRDSFTQTGRTAAGTAGLDAAWVPTEQWSSTMDAAAVKLVDELALRSTGNRWFGLLLDEVAFESDEVRPDGFRLPLEDWYLERFNTRLARTWTVLATGLPPGRFASDAAYLGGAAPTSSSPEFAPAAVTAWQRSLNGNLAWLRVELNFAYEMRQALIRAAEEFRQFTLAAGADAATAAALARKFRADRMRDFLVGRGRTPKTYGRWLAKEKLDTDVFGAWLSAVHGQPPAASGDDRARVTARQIAKYKDQLATAGEVTRQMPYFAGQFATAVARAATLARAIRDQAGDEDRGRFRTPDDLSPSELTALRHRVESELSALYQRVWNDAVSAGAAAGSERWQATRQRWDDVAEWYWQNLRTEVAESDAAEAGPAGPATEPEVQSPGAAATGTGDVGGLPSTLPPVELTPMATPRPAEASVTIQPEPEPDARQQYRAGFYERVGAEPPAQPATEFAPDADGERAELEWSLDTLAAHGTQWLDRGFDFLDAGTPAAREQILIDAIRNAPAGTLRALGGLIRGVDAHPERDMPVSYAAKAVHQALTGRPEEGARLIFERWRRAYPPRDQVRDALVDRSTASAGDREALGALLVALMTC